MYKKIIKDSQFIGKNFSDEFITNLCYKIKEKTYAPE